MTEGDRLKQKTVSSLIWKLLERGGNQLVALVVQVVMARLLAPEVFGMLAIMLVFVNVGNVIVQSGLNTALVQSPHACDDDFSTVFWMSLALSIALYGAVFLLAPAVESFYGMSGLAWPLRALCLILIINAYNAVQIAKVTRDLAFKKIFVATICSVLVSGVSGVCAALSGAGLWALVVQQISYQAVNCIVLAVQVPWKPRFVFRAHRAKILFGFGWKLLASGLLNSGYQSLGDLIIGKQFTSTQLGYVSQGKKYPQALCNLLDGAIQPVMMSAVAHVQSDVANVRRLVRRALKTSTFLIVPCMALFALVAQPLVSILLGPQWLPSVPILQMYCFNCALLPIQTTNLQALTGMGRSDLFLKLELVKKGYGIVILLFCAFVLKDIYAIVAGYMVGGVLAMVVNTRPNRKVIGYSLIDQVKDIMPAFGLALVSAAAAWPLGLAGLSSVATILLQALAMLGLYVLLAKLLRIEAFSYLVATSKELFHRKAPR